MIKRKVLLILFLLFSIFSNAQNPTVVETYKNCMGVYNQYTGNYDFQPYTYSNITFIMYDSYISVNDKQHSIYRSVQRLADDITKDYEAVTIRCLDEKNRECNFALMKFNNGEMRILVVYPKNLLFVYNINQ